MIRLNTGFNDFPRPWAYKAYHHAVPVKDISRMETDTNEYQLAGRLCESGDVLSTGKTKQRLFPNVKSGEWIAILGIPYACMMRMQPYCIFPGPLDIAVDADGWRKAKRITDYVNLEKPEYMKVN